MEMGSFESYSEHLFDVIKSYASPKELAWIETKINTSPQTIQTAFVATPRFIDKNIIIAKENQINGVDINGWTLDKLVRIYLLTTIDRSVKEDYTKTFDILFETAENNEAVALISALPFLAYPESWLLRATDAVRSNIGPVFDAIAFQNTYPMHYFSELAWNQLVLKCIFNDKPIHKIKGLDERINQELANSISNLAHERWAAGRNIPSQAWRLVSKFVDDALLNDIIHLFDSQNKNDQIAAALVCGESSFIKAQELLKKLTMLNKNIESKNLNWQMLEN